LDVSVAQMPVRGIIFDKDGTLFDFATTWEAWAAAFLLRVSQGDQARAGSLGAAIGFDFAARALSLEQPEKWPPPWCRICQR
jgi:phosphoglycolate phosphatase